MSVSAQDSHRLETVERAVADIRDAVGQIADAMVKIARLEERHQETRESLGRAFERIEAVERAQSDQRVELVTLKAQIKPLEESRGWMVTAMLGTIGLVGAAALSLVLAK